MITATSTLVASPVSPADRILRTVVTAGVGAVCGGASVLNWFAASAVTGVTMATVIAAVVAGAVTGLVALLLLDYGARRMTRSLPADVQARLAKYEPFALLPALLPLAGSVGFFFPPPVVTLLLVAGARAIAVLAAMSPQMRRDAATSTGYLAFLFLISGFAALVYQIVWQRTLFTAFGVNIESITIIVSLFMFGLGIGSFVGGLLSHRYPNFAPQLFFACELGIGLFGAVSLPLIGAVSKAALHGSLFQVSLAVFALLCLPTMLMGATLPILVAHLYRHLRSVGQSVGLLYCINTVGSAIACFLTAEFLFVALGQQASVAVAAMCNLTVGVLVFRFARQIARRAVEPGAPVVASEPVVPDSAERQAEITPTTKSSMTHRWFVLFFAAATGYISLSQEMVWMRIVSYMTGGRPAVFAHVLGFFLVGIAFGAWMAEKLCQRYFSDRRAPVRFIAVMLLISGLFYYLSIPATSQICRLSLPAGVVVTHLIVAVVSFLLGGIFPVLCHYGARSGSSVGLAVSRLYLANIVGSTLGPLLTGFVWMEYASTGTIVMALSIATVLLGGLAWLFDGGRRWFIVPVASVAASLLLLLAFKPLYGGLLEGLQCDRDRPWHSYRFVVENRHGIIATAAAPGGDTIYGGGMYDGTFNTDPVVNSNWITRCYMMAALHPEPKEVLEIGLSSGSWTRVMANYSPVQHLTAVEINPGYLDLIRNYPEQATILSDPKVTIAIDDGRRWLNRNPDRKFDFILQNTTHHWRSQITNLVSREYLQLCKAHLNPGGVMYFNTTFCDDITFTAGRVFEHIVKYGNFVAASDEPFGLTPGQIRANLLKFKSEPGFFPHGGGPVFDESDPKYKQKLDELVQAGANLRDPFEIDPPGGAAYRVITDDNMLTEYKLTKWFSRQRAWPKYLADLARPAKQTP